jgi:hypothetical protein
MADKGKIMLSEAALKMPHAGHERHLCLLQNIGFLKENLEEYKKCIRGAQYVCKGCGRAANDAQHLCFPEKL